MSKNFDPRYGSVKTARESAVDMSKLSPDDLFQEIPDNIHKGAIRFLNQDVIKALVSDYGENLERLRSRFPKSEELNIIMVGNFYKEAFQDLQRRTNKQTGNESVQVEENPVSQAVIEKEPIKEKPERSDIAKALGNARRYLETRELDLNGFTVRLVSNALDQFDFEQQIIIIKNIEKILAAYPPTLSKMMSNSLVMHFKLKLGTYAGTLGEAMSFFENKLSEMQEKPVEKASVVETIAAPAAKPANVVQAEVTQQQSLKPVEERATKQKLRVKNDPLAKEMMLAMNTPEKGTIVKLYFGIGEGLNPLTTEEVVKKMNSSGKNKVTLTKVQQTILEFIDDYKKRNQAICDTLTHTLKSN